MHPTVRFRSPTAHTAESEIYAPRDHCWMGGWGSGGWGASAGLPSIRSLSAWLVGGAGPHRMCPSSCSACPVNKNTHSRNIGHSRNTHTRSARHPPSSCCLSAWLTTGSGSLPSADAIHPRACAPQVCSSALSTCATSTRRASGSAPAAPASSSLQRICVPTRGVRGMWDCAGKGAAPRTSKAHHACSSALN